MTDIAGLFRNAKDVEYHPKGTVVFEEGAPAASMYVVRRGQVAIRLGNLTLETIAEGGFLGEMALVDDRTRSATAVAIEDCELVPIDERRFLFLIRETPFFALAVMRTMARRLRAMNERTDRSA
jgi:CRP/FNR family transcriptional regulator, cyclic AMP receptor protein